MNSGDWDGPESSLAAPHGESLPVIAKTLEDATPALDFTKPLTRGDPRWVDLSPARADSARDSMVKKLVRTPAGEHRHIAFVSHRGTGKSTELLHLSASVSDWYTPLYFVANTEMDPVQIAREDLLLVLAQGIESFMRNQGLPLDQAQTADAAKPATKPLDAGRD